MSHRTLTNFSRTRNILGPRFPASRLSAISFGGIQAAAGRAAVARRLGGSAARRRGGGSGGGGSARLARGSSRACLSSSSRSSATHTQGASGERAARGACEGTGEGAGVRAGSRRSAQCAHARSSCLVRPVFGREMKPSGGTAHVHVPCGVVPSVCREHGRHRKSWAERRGDSQGDFAFLVRHHLRCGLLLPHALPAGENRLRGVGGHPEGPGRARHADIASIGQHTGRGHMGEYQGIYKLMAAGVKCPAARHFQPLARPWSTQATRADYFSV